MTLVVFGCLWSTIHPCSRVSSPRPQAAEQLQCPLPASLPLLRFRSHSDIFVTNFVACCMCFVTKAQGNMCLPSADQLGSRLWGFPNLTDSQSLAGSSKFKSNYFDCGILWLHMAIFDDLCTFNHSGLDTFHPKLFTSLPFTSLYIPLPCCSSASPKKIAKIRTSLEVYWDPFISVAL